MSDNINALIANPQPVDVLGQYQRWQELAKEQAATRLTQAQATGAGISNALQGLNLARVNYAYGQAGIPGVGGAPAGQGAGGPLLGAGGQPPAGLAPAPSASPAGPAGAAGADQGGGGLPSSYPGAVGARMLGVPLPPLVAAGVMAAQDQSVAFKSAQEARRQAVFSTVSGAPPAQYPAAMQQLYEAGWITPQMYQDALSHPEGRQRIIQATQTPESYQSAQTAAMGQGLQYDPNTGQPTGAPGVVAGQAAQAGAKTAATEAASLPFAGPRAAATAAGTATGSGAMQEIKMRDPATGDVNIVQVPAAQAASFLQGHQGATRATVGDMMDPNVTVSPATYVARNQMFENAGGNPAARNPNSSATGNAQFTDETWRDTVAAAHPAWAQGLTDAQLLAARTDPDKAKEMAWAYAQQNGQRLAAAGLPVNTQTVGLSHNLGPGDISRLLAAAPNTPMSQVVSPAAMEANPQWRKQTAAQVMSNAATVYGLNKVDVSQPWMGAPAAGAPPAAVPASGAGVGQTQLSPQAAAGLDVTKEQIRRDQGVVEGSMGAANAAQAQQANLLQLRELGGQINSGSYGEARQAVQNYLATFAPQFGQDFVKALTLGNIDPSKAGVTQQFVKQALNTASTAEKANNPQGGLGITQVYQSAFPNLETQPTAIRDMANLFLINQQRTIDHAQGQQQYLQQQQTAFGVPGHTYQSVQNFDQQFQKTNAPQVYVAAAAALNDIPFDRWTKGLTPDQQKQALGIAWRADPTATILGPDGRTRKQNPALAAAGAAR